MEIRINTLHIRQAHSLPENHLVERANEKGIEEAPMEYRKTYDTADELEIIEMLGIDARVWVDLQGVIIVG